ncbi:creatininase family protein [Paenibacillus koleovorans]|uniref:creatininase family protein n=1 Tax=Paenibacillus koleovorans TaxID=121608 RepID=UPI0013E29098|nr:creatininase family protein [Paenibacillus koleovorans]
MKLIHMRPEQIKEAVGRNVPLLMAAGVVEYHGPHLPIGTDLLIAESIAARVERRCECVLAPSFPYGPTMEWAGGSEEGEMDFEPEPFARYVKETLRHFLKMGFKRIYVLQHHAGPEGLQSLCIRQAAAALIRETGLGWGAGWGRKPKEELPDPNVFRSIRVAGPSTFSGNVDAQGRQLSFGHAGQGETEFILADWPEDVDLARLADMSPLPYWLRDAHKAGPEQGERWLEFCTAGWVRELGGKESEGL